MDEPEEAKNIIPAVRIVPDIPAIFADGAISQNWGLASPSFTLAELTPIQMQKREAHPCLSRR